MQTRWQQLLGPIGVCAGVLAIVMTRTDVVTGVTGAVFATVTALLAGVSLGYVQYLSDRQSTNEERPFFDSPVAYTAWWAVFYTLFFLLPWSVVPWWAVSAVFTLQVLVTVALGGLDPRVTPAYWLSEYRDGKADALGDD